MSDAPEVPDSAAVLKRVDRAPEPCVPPSF